MDSLGRCHLPKVVSLEEAEPPCREGTEGWLPSPCLEGYQELVRIEEFVMEIWERFLFWSGESMADKLESLLEADEEDWDECFEK